MTEQTTSTIVSSQAPPSPQPLIPNLPDLTPYPGQNSLLSPPISLLSVEIMARTWNGKTYVMGGCVVDNWARSMNCESWDRVPSPIEVRDKWMHASAVIGSRIYAMADRGGVVYNAESGQWGNVSKRLDLGWRGRATVVGNVLYCYDYLGKIRGYDVEKDVWKELKGVEKELPKFLCGATMVNLDEKLCVVWEGKGSGKEVEIMCAEIEVKKDADGGLRGTILWSDVILVAPNGASIVHCLAVVF